MEARAKQRGRAEAKTLEFWFRKKHNLPPNHPALLALTVEELKTEYWAHQYYDNPPKDEVSDDDFDKDAVLQQIAAEAEAEEQALRDARDVDDYEDVIHERFD